MSENLPVKRNSGLQSFFKTAKGILKNPPSFLTSLSKSFIKGQAVKVIKKKIRKFEKTQIIARVIQLVPFIIAIIVLAVSKDNTGVPAIIASLLLQLTMLIFGIRMIVNLIKYFKLIWVTTGNFFSNFREYFPHLFTLLLTSVVDALMYIYCINDLCHSLSKTEFGKAAAKWLPSKEELIYSVRNAFKIEIILILSMIVIYTLSMMLFVKPLLMEYVAGIGVKDFLIMPYQEFIPEKWDNILEFFGIHRVE